MRLWALSACLLSLATHTVAGDFRLAIPIDCTLGETCHIQQFVDHDPGPGASDFRCQGLSYDGHKGTDFALPFLRDIASDVAVISAAPGVVRGVRDGMADQLFTQSNAADIEGRECGNGVVIRHDDGWESQYCHLKKGSVTVARGARVATGTRLGSVGLSGRTQFPHLHFTLRRDGKVVDPFAPDLTQDSVACSSYTDAGLWEPPLPYKPGGIIASGFHHAVPKYDRIKLGTADAAPLLAEADAFVFCGFAYGGQTHDILRLRVDGPEGFQISKQFEQEKPQAQFFRAAGKRRKSELWPAGPYTGRVTLLRDGRVIDEITQVMTIR